MDFKPTTSNEAGENGETPEVKDEEEPGREKFPSANQYFNPRALEGRIMESLPATTHTLWKARTVEQARPMQYAMDQGKLNFSEGIEDGYDRPTDFEYNHRKMYFDAEQQVAEMRCMKLKRGGVPAILMRVDIPDDFLLRLCPTVLRHDNEWKNFTWHCRYPGHFRGRFPLSKEMSSLAQQKLLIGPISKPGNSAEVVTIVDKYGNVRIANQYAFQYDEAMVADFENPIYGIRVQFYFI